MIASYILEANDITYPRMQHFGFAPLVNVSAQWHRVSMVRSGSLLYNVRSRADITAAAIQCPTHS